MNFVGFAYACLGEEVGSRVEDPCRGSRGLKATLVGFRGKAPWSILVSLLSMLLYSNFVPFAKGIVRPVRVSDTEKRPSFSGSERKNLGRVALNFIPPKPGFRPLGRKFAHKIKKQIGTVGTNLCALCVKFWGMAGWVCRARASGASLYGFIFASLCELICERKRAFSVRLSAPINLTNIEIMTQRGV